MIPIPDSPAKRRSLVRIFILLGAVTAALSGGAWVWSSLDMAFAVLLGCSVVAFNLLGTAHFVGAVLAEHAFRGRLVASLVVKLVLTLIVLYIAVNRWGMNPVGIVVGLSSMLVVSLLYTMIRKPQSPQPAERPDRTT